MCAIALLLLVRRGHLLLRAQEVAEAFHNWQCVYTIDATVVSAVEAFTSRKWSCGNGGRRHGDPGGNEG